MAYDNTPSFLVSASQRESKAGTKYTWSKTFDLNEVAKKLGTSIVTISVFVRKKGDDVKPTDRVIVFNPSEPKWLPKDTQNTGGDSNATQNSNDGDIVI